MLDFYIIKDDQSKPNYPEQVGLEFAGGIESNTFDNLQDKGIIDFKFDYYSDFRLESALIKQIQQIVIQKRLSTDNEVKKLLVIFEKAFKAESGLIAYCD